MAEETFSNNLGEEPTTMEGNFPVALEEMTTSPINKVGSKTNQMVSYTKQEKPQVDFLLVLFCQANALNWRRIFYQFSMKNNKEAAKNQESSKNVSVKKDCCFIQEWEKAWGFNSKKQTINICTNRYVKTSICNIRD